MKQTGVRERADGSQRTLPGVEEITSGSKSRFKRLTHEIPFVLLLLASVIGDLHSQEPLVLSRINGPVELDGLSDEPAWESIEPLPVIMQSPNFGGPPSERTEIRIAYDDKYIYVSGRFYDSEPELIQTTSLQRDVMSPTADQFGVILDTFNDRENGVFFYTTSRGARVDATISNDATSRPLFNRSWNTFWDAAGVQNGDGWFAEMRIPFSSLRFQDEAGRVTMSLIAYRWIARKTEVVLFPAIEPKWGFFSLFKPSQAREVVFEGVYSSKPLYVTPYGIGGVGQSFVLDTLGTSYEPEDQLARDVGLDMKYGLANNLTLDVTVNTDFAQVEADDQQVNLTRFSLFFPEKRLFFQERASIFEFQTGDQDNLFYSRRIGISGGEVVPIYGGARLIGRLGDWDLGFLDMQTRAAAGLPSENFGVLRLRRRVFNENSYVGGIATSRVGSEGSYNVAYGLDGIIRAFGEDYVTFNLAQTFDGEENGSDLFDASLVRARWERRTIDGFGYDLSATRVGVGYDPGVGFVRRTGFTRIGDRLFRGWTPGRESGILRHILSLNGHLFLRNLDRSLESAEVGPEWNIEVKTGAILTVGAKASYEDLSEPFELSDDASVPAGSYTFYDLNASLQNSRGSLVRWVAKAAAGSFYDGSQLMFSLAPTWSVSRHLEIHATYQYNRVSFPDRGQRFDAHISRLRIRTALSHTLSAATFIQHSSASNGVIGNFRLRFNPQEGSDLYIVYNHRLNTDRNRQMPALPPTDRRTLLVKYSYTFTLGS